VEEPGGVAGASLVRWERVREREFVKVGSGHDEARHVVAEAVRRVREGAAPALVTGYGAPVAHLAD
jgi:hypothetical protein